MSRSPPARDAEQGVILVHVLATVSVCSAVMVLLFSVQDRAIDTLRDATGGAQARSIALGVETSARIALSRDAREAPEADHAAEAWAGINEMKTDIPGGRLSVELSDSQGRFNLNTLLTGGLASEDVLERLLIASGDPAAGRSAAQISALVRDRAGLADLSAIDRLGLDPDVRARLAGSVCVLPEPTPVNLNAAPTEVMAALLGNEPVARLIVSRRDQRGYLTQEDFTSAGVLPPALAGFQSRHFTLDVTAEIDGVRLRLLSNIERVPADGTIEARIWQRQIETSRSAGTR
jgi:general secretion pathway protein K